MARIQLAHTFEDIISLENLLIAWQEFKKGKSQRVDVQFFGRHLMDNIILLHQGLSSLRYRHGSYEAFRIADPKPRQIHKASVRDRVLHHAIYQKLYPFFDRAFIADSFSCRKNKGQHKAINRLRQFTRQVSRNDTRACWILQCDIRRFFDNIDHGILQFILEQYIPDKQLLWLLDDVIGSFNSGQPSKGLPLGNLTSQLLVNIYMNEFDQHVKQNIKAKYYVRYADDFLLLSSDRDWLVNQVPKIQAVLWHLLQLELHPSKVSISTFASGVDFLGWVNFSDHRVLRTRTKKRMLRRIRERTEELTIKSYLGLLSHGQTNRLRDYVLTNFGEQL